MATDVILYGLEVTDPKKSVLVRLDNLIDRAVLKIFSMSEKHVVRDIRHFLGLYDVALLCEKRRVKFFNVNKTRIDIMLFNSH